MQQSPTNGNMQMLRYPKLMSKPCIIPPSEAFLEIEVERKMKNETVSAFAFLHSLFRTQCNGCWRFYSGYNAIAKAPVVDGIDKGSIWIYWKEK